MERDKISQDTNSLNDINISVKAISSKNLISDDFSKFRLCCFSYNNKLFFVDNFNDFFVKLHCLLIEQFPNIYNNILDKKIFWSSPKNNSFTLLPNFKWILVPENGLDAIYYIQELEKVFNTQILVNLSLFRLVTEERIFESNKIKLGTASEVKSKDTGSLNNKPKYAELPKTLLKIEDPTSEVRFLEDAKQDVDSEKTLLKTIKPESAKIEHIKIEDPTSEVRFVEDAKQDVDSEKTLLKTIKPESAKIEHIKVVPKNLKKEANIQQEETLIDRKPQPINPDSDKVREVKNSAVNEHTDISFQLEPSAEPVKDDPSVEKIELKKLDFYNFNEIVPIQFMFNGRYINVTSWNEFIDKFIKEIVAKYAEVVLSLVGKKISKSFRNIYFINQLPENFTDKYITIVDSFCYFVYSDNPAEIIDAAISICRKVGISPVINFEIYYKLSVLQNDNEIINGEWIRREAANIENEIWKSRSVIMEYPTECTKYPYANLKRANSPERFAKLGVNLRYFEIDSNIFYVNSYFEILFYIYKYFYEKYEDKFRKFADNSNDLSKVDGEGFTRLNEDYFITVSVSIEHDIFILKVNAIFQKMGLNPNTALGFYITAKTCEDKVKAKAFNLAKERANNKIEEQKKLNEERVVLDNLKEIPMGDLPQDETTNYSKKIEESSSNIEINPNNPYVSKELSQNISNLVVPSSSESTEKSSKIALDAFSPITKNINKSVPKNEDIASQDYVPTQEYKPVTEYKPVESYQPIIEEKVEVVESNNVSNVSTEEEQQVSTEMPELGLPDPEDFVTVEEPAKVEEPATLTENVTPTEEPVVAAEAIPTSSVQEQQPALTSEETIVEEAPAITTPLPHIEPVINNIQQNNVTSEASTDEAQSKEPTVILDTDLKPLRVVRLAKIIKPIPAQSAITENKNSDSFSSKFKENEKIVTGKGYWLIKPQPVRSVEPAPVIAQPTQPIRPEEPAPVVAQPTQPIRPEEPAPVIAQPVRPIESDPFVAQSDPFGGQSTQPIRPVEPAPIVAQPVQQVAQPVQQVAQPVQQVAQPVQQVAQPVQQVAQPVQQVAQPVQQVAQPVQQVAQPVQQVAKPVQQVAQPKEEIKTLDDVRKLASKQEEDIWNTSLYIYRCRKLSLADVVSQYRTLKQDGYRLRYGSIGLQNFYVRNFADCLFYMCSYFLKNMPGKFKALTEKYPNYFIPVGKSLKSDRVFSNNFYLEISNELEFQDFINILGEFCKVMGMNPSYYLYLYFSDFDLNFKVLLKALEELQIGTGLKTSEYVKIVEKERRIFEEAKGKEKEVEKVNESAKKVETSESVINLPESLKTESVSEEKKSEVSTDTEEKQEEPEILVKKYEDFDDFAPVKDSVYLKSNKSYYLKSFSFKDHSVASKSLNYVIFTLFYIISKKKPDIIKHWAGRKLNGLSLTKPADCKFSRKLANDCWLTIPSFSMSNYRSLINVAIKGLKADFSDLSFYFTNKAKTDENNTPKKQAKDEKDIVKAKKENVKVEKADDTDSKLENDGKVKISYKYFDEILLDNGNICLSNNKNFLLSSFVFKDFTYDTNSIETIIYFLFYFLSKKDSGIIKYWAIKNRYGIQKKKPEDQSVVSRKLSNDCWIVFKNSNSMDYYKKMFEIVKSKLDVDFEQELYFIFKEKDEENTYTDEAFENNNASDESELVKEKNKMLEEAKTVKLMKKAEGFADKFIR